MMLLQNLQTAETCFLSERDPYEEREIFLFEKLHLIWTLCISFIHKPRLFNWILNVLTFHQLMMVFIFGSSLDKLQLHTNLLLTSGTRRLVELLFHM